MFQKKWMIFPKESVYNILLIIKFEKK
jgi:hypothetical protein